MVMILLSYLPIDFENISMGCYNSGGGRGAMRQGQFWDLDIAVLKRLDILRPGCGPASRNNQLIWGRICISFMQRQVRIALTTRSV